MAHNFEIEIHPERIIRGTVELPSEEFWPAPLVLFCHGFKGDKDWGPWPWFTAALARQGFVVGRINFSHCGVGVATEGHDEPDKFAINTYGLEMDDLHSALERREKWRLPKGCAQDRVGLVGHSRGGMVSLLAASEIPVVAAITTLGSPGFSDRFPREVKDLWRENGFHEIVNQRTGQVLRMDLSVLEDYERCGDRYDVAAAVTRRSIPTLVIHGDADETVGVDEAHVLFGGIAHADKELSILEGAGHTFGTVHAFDDTQTEYLERVLESTTRWFRKYLA